MSKRELKRTMPKDFTVTPVDELPTPDRLRTSFYDQILDQINLDRSDKRFFRVEVPNKTFKSLYAPILTRIQKRGFPMRVRVSKQKLYVQKLTDEEFTKYLKSLEDRRTKHSKA